MVTQDGNHTISMVVRVQLLLDSPGCWRTLIKLLLESDRRVIGTEHLRCETLHVLRQVVSVNSPVSWINAR